MFGFFEYASLLLFAAYLALIAFLIWLFYRFVKAHESIADSLRQWVFIQRRKQEE